MKNRNIYVNKKDVKIYCNEFIKAIAEDFLREENKLKK